jgi:CheY-like chemotaxis protein
MQNDSALSILLIEDEPDAARLIEHILTKGQAGGVVLDWAPDLRTGLEHLSQRAFQAILLDLNLPDSTGFDTFTRIRRQAPGQAVVVLTGQEDEGLALQAVRAGADEFLLKSDIRDRFLAQRIRYAVERHRIKSQNTEKRQVIGKIFSFVGTKGGAGTTTLVLNTAAALAQLGKNVIAIELMPEYGCFGPLLNHTTTWDISMLVQGPVERFSRDAVASCLEDCVGFRAICGPQRTENYRPLLPEQVLALLATVRGMADYILVDVPSTSVPAMSTILQYSALTAVVVERNRTGFCTALAKLPGLAAMAPHPAALCAILVDKTPFVEFLTPSDFSKKLGCSVFAVIPPAPELPGSGEQAAVPVVGLPDNPFSKMVQELARRLIATAPPVKFDGEGAKATGFSRTDDR